jgi:hypothetical protein
MTPADMYVQTISNAKGQQRLLREKTTVPSSSIILSRWWLSLVIYWILAKWVRWPVPKTSVSR